MRAEDKELEGPELEREQRLEPVEETKHEEELPVLASEEVVDVELAHRGRLFDALSLILERQDLNVSLLQLPRRETKALEFVQTAVSGRDVHMGEFVYAEDRKAMLEQALAVLQQNITHGSSAEIAALHAKFDALAHRLGELRAQLAELEEAQDDHEYHHAPHAKTAATDTPDKPDESLTGFLASALSALAKVAGDKPASSLGGPELPEVARPPSTLVGEPAAVAPRPPSTLSAGPEVPERTPPPSTLGEPKGTR